MSRPKNYLEAVGYRSIPLEDSEKPVKFSISARNGAASELPRTAVPRHQSLQQMVGDGQLLCESIAEQSSADGDS
jgi:hypothetical protein